MHDTAVLTGNAFFRIYGDPIGPGAKILDVGSLDVNGSLRPLAPKGCEYVGVDIMDGLNVTTVLDDSGMLPFGDGEFDLVVSTSCLEHDPMFWMTFAEMARVVKMGGFVYVSVPSNGPYHGYPGDCWRFYADAARALARWTRRVGVTLDVVETFMMQPRKDVWVDNVMVFGKPAFKDRGSLHKFLDL